MDLFLTILFILVCLLLIGVVLIQKGRGGGLSGAFGGAGGHSAFGSRTGDMFTWVTVVLVGLFLLLGVVAVRYFRPPPEPTRQAAAATSEPNAAEAETATDLDTEADAEAISEELPPQPPEAESVSEELPSQPPEAEATAPAPPPAQDAASDEPPAAE